MKKWIGFSRAAVLALALAVLGPAIAQSETWLCFVHRNSHAGNTSCHGTGGGCLDCILIEYSTNGGGAPRDFLPQGAVAVSYPSRLDRTQEPNQPVSLALDTALSRTPLKQFTCEEPSLYDRVRMASLERAPTITEDHARTELAGRLDQESTR